MRARSTCGEPALASRVQAKEAKGPGPDSRRLLLYGRAAFGLLHSRHHEGTRTKLFLQVLLQLFTQRPIGFRFARGIGSGLDDVDDDARFVDPGADADGVLHIRLSKGTNRIRDQRQGGPILEMPAVGQLGHDLFEEKKSLLLGSSDSENHIDAV